jgi:hypothetical protein
MAQAARKQKVDRVTAMRSIDGPFAISNGQRWRDDFKQLRNRRISDAPPFALWDGQIVCAQCSAHTERVQNFSFAAMVARSAEQKRCMPRRVGWTCESLHSLSWFVRQPSICDWAATVANNPPVPNFAGRSHNCDAMLRAVLVVCHRVKLGVATGLCLGPTQVGKRLWPGSP